MNSPKQGHLQNSAALSLAAFAGALCEMNSPLAMTSYLSDAEFRIWRVEAVWDIAMVTERWGGVGFSRVDKFN